MDKRTCKDCTFYKEHHAENIRQYLFICTLNNKAYSHIRPCFMFNEKKKFSEKTSAKP